MFALARIDRPTETELAEARTTLLHVADIPAAEDFYTAQGVSFPNRKKLLRRLKRDWRKLKCNEVPEDFLSRRRLEVAGGEVELLGIIHLKPLDKGYGASVKEWVKQKTKEGFTVVFEDNLREHFKLRLGRQLVEAGDHEMKLVFPHFKPAFIRGLLLPVDMLRLAGGFLIRPRLTRVALTLLFDEAWNSKIMKWQDFYKILYKKISGFPRSIKLALKIEKEKDLNESEVRSAFMSEVARGLIARGHKKVALVMGEYHVAESIHFLRNPKNVPSLVTRDAEERVREVSNGQTRFNPESINFLVRAAKYCGYGLGVVTLFGALSLFV